jgi:hypothetical protein
MDEARLRQRRIFECQFVPSRFVRSATRRCLTIKTVNMLSQSANQKSVERYYLDQARKASSVFPAGEVTAGERPDFLIHTEHGVIGIEVTELCDQGPRSFAGKQTLVVRKAKRRYESSSNAVPVDVTAAFSPKAEAIPGGDLIRYLGDFVTENRESFLSRTVKNSYFDHSKGFLHIGIHSVLPGHDPTGKWVGMAAFGKTIAPQELLEEYIADKNDKVPVYHLTARVVWLLLVSDQFLGAGELYARPEDLSRWQFDFDFEKVLLFTREIGDEGSSVDELRRRVVDHPSPIT